ncbi:MAG: rhodanese-like domain-containing protein [Streptococcaceae bacterium]|jgi:rhodanese-related sulfurtransferase|nr:rhodanese-like domain-containing protein [Streptococcaceae bacterium]
MFNLFSKTNSISTGELQEILTTNPIILDVREDYEFTTGHIPGAKNVPLSTVGNYKANKGKKIYVICQSGMRSKNAYATLEKNGYDVINVTGGMSAWRGVVQRGAK